jgi:2-deoxy-D-gluconate 3-dehydrogenase
MFMVYNRDMENKLKIDQLLRLDGKSAIVTGGAKGIGRAIALRLCEAGAKVLIADMDEAALEATVDEIKSSGMIAEGVHVDISKPEDITNMINACKEKFQSLDILVNNAGIYPNKKISDMTYEDFDKVLSVNLKSVFLTTKIGSEIMKIRGGGRIINITSIDALHPSMTGLAHYDASKHGMWGFTKNSALELADHKIWVNAIAPGGILTPGVTASAPSNPDPNMMAEQTKMFMNKIPMHRFGDADEIAKVALFLASDMSSYMTGEQIVVDGGVLLS